MRPVRVLILTNYLGYGGTEKYVIALAKGLNRQKYRVMICTLRDYVPLARELTGQGIALTSMGVRSKLDAFVIRRLACLLRREGIELLHTNLYWSNLIGRLAGRMAGVPIVVAGERNTDIRRRFYQCWLDRCTSQWVDCIIANSQATLRWSTQATRISADKYVIIPNGVDLADFDPARPVDRQAVRRSLGLTPDDVIVGTVARLHEQKGHRFLVQAMPAILERFPQARFCFVGEGLLETDLKRQCREAGVASKVVFAGARDDVAAVLTTFDLFVLPSLYEGFGIVLLEAMAMCLPVVASDVGGIPEVVEAGRTGILVPPGDVASLAQAVIGVLSDREAAQAMGKAGRQRVQQHFALADRISETEKLYETLTARKLSRLGGRRIPGRGLQ